MYTYIVHAIYIDLIPDTDIDTIMCICPRVGKSNSIFDLRFDDKEKLVKKLPQLTEKRMIAVAKHILFKFLDSHADYIFTNGKIYTMDDDNHEVEAVATKGGDIVFVGKMVDALVYKGQKTMMVDLQGKVMLPGFIDPHVHMCFTMFRHWIDLSPFVNRCLKEVQDRLLKAIEEAKDKPEEWIAGQLYDPTVMEGQFDISLKNLDKICPNNPLFILEANGHVAHINTQAMKVAKFSKETKDPPHGRFVRDQHGQLTGQLQQSAVMLLKQFLLGSAEGYSSNFKAFLHHCASKGCTTLNDCGIGIVDPKADMAVLLDAMDNNPPVRYSGFLVSTAWETWMEQKMEPDYKDDYLRIHGIKCWADGSTQGGSAFLRENYLKQQWGKGNANYTLQQLTKSIKLAHDNNWQVAVHANGDAGIDLVLDAYEAVQKENPKPDLRHRIEHCTVCHKEQLKRMKELHITPSFLIGHVYFYGHVFKKHILGPQRADMVDPMKSAMDFGLRPTMHSDYNCQPVDPLRCLYNAVTRKMKFNNETLNPRECLTPYEALKAMTIYSAWQCHMDDIVGSIQKGKKADFVILNQNPMTIPENEMMSIKVVQTWMDGQRRYKSQDLTKFSSLNSAFSFNSQSSYKSKGSMASIQQQSK